MLTTMLVPAMKTEASETETVDVAIQENASNAYDELMSSFPASRATGEKIYPDHYGGSYINNEGKLVVYIKEGFAVPELLSTDDDIVYENCDYSYNELQCVMDELNEYKFDNQGNMIADNYNEFGLYDENNRVIVKLDELSDEAINNFKENVCDSDAIVFEQGNGPAQLEVNVNAGSSISTDSATASVGYRVKRNVTASWR